MAHQAAWTLAQQIAYPYFSAMVAIALCADKVVAEDWETAVQWAKTAVSFSIEGVLFFPSLDRWYEVAAWLRYGQRDQARKLVNRLRQAGQENRRYRLVYHRCLAVLAVADGDNQRAVKDLQTALALAEEMGLPGEQWQILVGLAELHPDAARQQAAKNQSLEIRNRLAEKMGDEKTRHLRLVQS